MLTWLGAPQRYCDGHTRRDFLRAGVLGATGLSLPALLRARAASQGPAVRSVILVCLPGGPSHIDLYDMKPDLPLEQRGEFRPIATRVPGIQICEHLPLQARIADQLAIVRNMTFTQPNHQLHEVYTGFTETERRPAFGSVVSRLRQDPGAALPRYVSLSLSDHPRTVGVAEVPSYAGLAHAPFEPAGDFLANLQGDQGLGRVRLESRQALVRSFDGMRRHLDASGTLEAMDDFTAQAVRMLTAPEVREAFDVDREPRAIREMYGPDVKLKYNYQFGHTWYGTRFLQARRLVEAGVPVVTLGMGGWDHHGNLNGVRGSIFERFGEQLPLYDRSIHALVTDLRQRGLDREVAVLVWGEFGRTPRVNRYGGRDHWTPAGFALLAGGGMPMGQTIGATDAQGARPRGKAYTPQNVFATLYRLLGIDPDTTISDFTGRPQHLLTQTEPIRELLG